jgi:hypothetical protein
MSPDLPGHCGTPFGVRWNFGRVDRRSTQAPTSGYYLATRRVVVGVPNNRTKPQTQNNLKKDFDGISYGCMIHTFV